MLQLFLASQSPRRRELLSGAGYEFTVSLVKVSEIFDENMNPREVASHLATIKAEAAWREHKPLKAEGNLILGADTIVVLREGSSDQILGKPENSEEAADFLRRLSGTTHEVMTGMALLKSGSPTQLWSGTVVTRVTFRELSSEDIFAYVATGEPMDKAGAYGLQGEARKFVSRIEGSWSNVVGLPLEKLETVLLEKGWRVARRPIEKA